MVGQQLSLRIGCAGLIVAFRAGLVVEQGTHDEAP
jgi:hypothetical protein